tara:strand:+ start:181 stop:360 length:180 start_codon:yes stop_codon:yes gene_type:complete
MTKAKQAKRLKRQKAKRKVLNMRKNGLSFAKKQELAKWKKQSNISNLITSQKQSYGSKR